jgi:molecular chaperone DnaJ
MSDQNKDLYAILGVKEDASAADIKKAYRAAAKQYHPDRTGGDKAKESKFKEMSAAYEVLSDDKRRQQYDTMRKGGFHPGGGVEFDPSAFEGIDGIEDLLGSLFGAGRPRGAGRAGRAGRAGAPHIVFETRGFDGDFGGSPFGRNGGGAYQVHQEPQEQQIRTRDGAVLTQKGYDFYWELELAVHEAVLGTKADVPTIDGKVTLTVPAGTSSGTKLRLRGRGAPRPNGEHGDEYVTVKIVVPTRIDKKADDLIREFAKVAPVKPKRG